MAAFPVEILLGIYLGLLTGIIPAVVAWILGFLFKYFTGVTVPALAVVVLSLAIAGTNGGLLALNDPTVRGAPNSVTLTTAIIVVLMVSIYAHSQGDRLGASFPKRLSLRKLRERTLSTDVIQLVGSRSEVSITVTGEIEDMEGYPALPPTLRTELHDKEWTFPADLPLSELETRLADKLKTDFDLADVSVHIDEQGRATIAAAPPASGLSKRVPTGKRAVSVGGLIPTGLARGDDVEIILDDATIPGIVVSAQSTVSTPPPVSGSSGTVETDGGTVPSESEPHLPPVATTTGGDGRITVAVNRTDAERLLDADRGKVIVRARGKRREFELLSLLRRAGKRLRKLTIGAGSELAGTTVGDVAIRDTYGVAILAVRGSDGWTIAPRGSASLSAGDVLFVVGTRENLARFQEVLT